MQLRSGQHRLRLQLTSKHRTKRSWSRHWGSPPQRQAQNQLRSEARGRLISSC